MASRAGPRSGVTSSWARSSTLPDSANAPPTNTVRLCRPTTTPRAPWMKPASICKKHSSARKTDSQCRRERPRSCGSTAKPSTSGDACVFTYTKPQHERGRLRLHLHQTPARARTLASTLESALHGQRDHGFRDQLFFCIFFRENFGLANDQHLARAQHPAAAAQAVGHGRTQEINLELDADHIVVHPDGAPGRAAGRMVRHGGQHAGMNQAVLLPVTLGRHQGGFAVFVFDPGQLHAQLADEIGAVEDAADLNFQEFAHSIYEQPPG